MILNGRIITCLFAKKTKRERVLLLSCVILGDFGGDLFESFTTMGGLSQKMCGDCD